MRIITRKVLREFWAPGRRTGMNIKSIKTKDEPHLDALRWTANFYLSDAVYRAILTLAGEA